MRDNGQQVEEENQDRSKDMPFIVFNQRYSFILSLGRIELPFLDTSRWTTVSKYNMQQPDLLIILLVNTLYLKL